jgi:hypothetical protein
MNDTPSTQPPKSIAKRKPMYGPPRTKSQDIKKKPLKRKDKSSSDSDFDVITEVRKKKNLKRKEPSSSETDSDDDTDATTSLAASGSKSKRRKKIPPHVPHIPTDNISFHSAEGANRWRFIFHRRLAAERNLSTHMLECQELVSLINDAGLMKIVTGLGNCYEMLTKEFLVNIGDDCDDPMSPEFRKVFVRGKCVEFSPDVINQYLGRSTAGVVDLGVTQNEICKTLTGNLVKVWPQHNLPANKLTAKYALLNKIAAANWAPTTHSNSVASGLAKLIYAIGTRSSFDYGNYIFHETVMHGETHAVKMPNAFPTLLCDIILHQHPGICTEADVPKRRDSDLSLDYRLFEGAHAADIAVPTARQPPGILTR